MRISDWSSDVCSSDLINANRRRCRQSGIEIADATQREHRGAECRPRIGQTRDGLGQILDAADTLLDELIATDRRNREADLVDRFSALAGGDDDLAGTQTFTLRRFGGCGLGSRLLRRRSEEHTSELQSLMRISYAVFCLKKKKLTNDTHH